MISILKSKFLILGFVFIAVLLIPTNNAFADHAEVSIVTVDESGFSQTCTESNGGQGCYVPLTATVDVGGVVTMTNTDPTGVHTFTSGTVDGFTPSPDGVFDSGVLMSNDAFEWSPTEAGTVPYYCMLHTWMVGEIIVQEVAAEEAVSEVDLKFQSVTPDVWLPEGQTGYDIRELGTVRIDGVLENPGSSITVFQSVKLEVTNPNGVITHGDSNCHNIDVGDGNTCSFQNNIRIESDFAIGTWSYQLTIDPDNDWSETNENNNVYTGTFEVCSSQCTDSDLKFDLPFFYLRDDA
mgnify:FL=1